MQSPPNPDPRSDPTRRDFLKTAALLAAGSAFSPNLHAQMTTKPSLHAYTDYSWLRGFGVVPSWGARIEEAWTLYDGARMREEVALARQVHANCIRLWVEFTAWMCDPDKVTADFMDAVSAIAGNGMKVMPCLFNRWHDIQYDYGCSSRLANAENWKPQLDYVKTIVTPLANDDRILIWDLCNEPGAIAHDVEFTWLSDVAGTVRACGVKHPITMGTMSGANILNFAPLVDVLNGHPYAHDREGIEKLIFSFKEMRQSTGKPFLVNETIPGALDDLVRADVARFYTEMLSAAGFGWMGWVIREGKAISTRRDRHDGNGINGGGFRPFFTKAGKLRDGLEFLTEKPALSPPWQKA